jgi:hypothetical protein
MSGIELMAAERERQVTGEGWTTEHDDTHVLGELSLAGAVYASVASAMCRGATVEEVQDSDMMIDASDWPFESACWKPTSDPIGNLVKAGALIAAEIDRLQRAPRRGR